MRQQITENLSSIMIYSGVSYMDAATSLANRNYEHYIESLGYLNITNSGASYWSKYPETENLYHETEYNFDQLKDIYIEANIYQNSFYEENGNIGIKTISSDQKTVSRYHAEYSYQDNLKNQFSNLVPYTADDLNNFLFSLNYQKYNKLNLYRDDFEVSSIRINSYNFNWHTSNDIAYEIVDHQNIAISYNFSYNNIEEETSYFSYIKSFEISDDDLLIYDNAWIRELHSSYTEYYDTNILGPLYGSLSYTYSYYGINTIYSYTSYYYGNDNYYTYFKKQYVPIINILLDEVSRQIKSYEDKYYNNEEVYTYYMYDFKVDLPMTLTTRSLGQKKSTFEMRYNSIYDKWFEYYIPMYIDFSQINSSEIPFIKLTAQEDGIFGIRSDNNVLVQNIPMTKDTTSIVNLNLPENYKNTLSVDNQISFLSPYNISEIDFTPVIPYLSNSLNISYTGWTLEKENNIKTLVFNTNSESDENLQKILGINDLTNISYLDLSNMKHLQYDPNISRLSNLHVYKATNSSIKTFKPANNVSLYQVDLPDTITNIRLQNVRFSNGTLNIFGEEHEFDGDFNYVPNNNLYSLVLDNVSGINTHSFVNTWIESLKSSDSLLPTSLIYLELSDINWNKVNVSMLEDMRQFDLNINNSTMFIKGTSNYGMLSRAEYMSITHKFGVNAFKPVVSTEKVFSGLRLVKYIDALPDYEYSFTLTSDADNKSTTIKLNNNDEQDSIIAVNSIIDLINGQTLSFVYNPIEKIASSVLNKPIDMKDTPNDIIPTLDYGDILVYNNDTIVFVMDHISNNKYQYTKIGNINDFTSTNNLKETFKDWFMYDTNNPIINISFEQYSKPQTVNEIILKNSENSIFDNTIEINSNEHIEVLVEVDNDNAENKTIGYSLNGDNILNVEQEENTNKYIISFININNLETSKSATIKFYLNEILNNHNINLKDYIYKELTFKVNP